MFQTAEEEEGGAIIAPLMAAQDRVADACLQVRAHELQAEAAGETLDIGIDVQAEMGALPAARQKQAETADGAKVGWFDVNGVLRHEDMVTDFEAAKEELLEAKVALMQAYTDAAQTKTGIEFNPADFTE